MTEISYAITPKFEQEFKKLGKKYRSLPEDLELAKRAAIELFHLHSINNQSIFPIPNCCTDKVLVCKLKKFACRALKGRGAQSGIRIIYAFYPQARRVEFIEIYFKGDKENEDKERIKNYLHVLS
jgi:mRNA-degrading endonuclease RelE of RelBE toxin-antitoxin system